MVTARFCEMALKLPVPSAEVARGRGDAGEELMLDAETCSPVVWPDAKTLRERRVVGRARDELAELVVGGSAALAVRCDVSEIAIRAVIPVAVIPRPRCAADG